MDATEYLRNELATEKARVRAILDAADAEGRAISPEEREVYTSAMENMAKIKSRLEDEEDKNKMRTLVDDFDRLHATGSDDPNPVREPARVKARSLGEAFVNSDGFKITAAKFKDAGKVRFRTPSIHWEGKSAGDPVLESDNSDIFGNGSTTSGILRTLMGLETPGFVQPRLTIADLFTSVPVTVGNAVTYPVVKTRTQISGTPQTEGSNKPGGEYEFDDVTKVLLTLAGWVKVSQQFLEDAPGLAAYINADLPLQIRQNEETYLVSTLESDISGNTADGTTLVASPNPFDAILEAIVTVQQNGGEPDGLVIDPFDWATIRATKFESSVFGYVSGGPGNGNPWNLRVVVSPGATAGAPIVGDFSRGGKIYRKGGLNVDSTNSDGTDFIKNLVTIRAEERLVLGTTYPEFFCVADIGTS
jgi:Phage capsid family